MRLSYDGVMLQKTTSVTVVSVQRWLLRRRLHEMLGELLMRRAFRA